MDISVMQYCVNKLSDNKIIDLLNIKLAVLDGVQVANAATESTIKNGKSIFSKYRSDIVRKLGQYINKEEETTIWGRAKKSERIS